ncbi:MmgE/PrpD family protein [Deferrisoma camini]|uniref:MmgE/PrpD family protein n=1 Tax=Deferrisoma camini TaxID=1035120 RepID=UPI00046C9C2F|nr:MmgE/PrpD family protein [Deferrisoma camini]
MDSPWTVERLAEFAVGASAEDLPPTATEAAGRCLIDTLGAAAAGRPTPAAKALAGFSTRAFAPGPCTVWYEGAALTPEAAAVANSAAASALDLDDGHRAAGGHPGAAVLPAALAAAELVGAPGRGVLEAVVVGYEVGVRVAAGRNPATLDTYSTGRWAAYAAAAAAGRLYGFSPDLLAHALAVAGVLSPGLSAAGYSRLMGNSTKEGIPWAVFTGLAALDLVRRGWTGPLDILDHPDYYDADRIANGLGGAPFAVEGVYFKPYGCCRWIHAALDALTALLSEHRISPEEIEEIRVDTFGRAVSLSNEPAPSTLEGAQYSIPFCLALAAVHGPQALLPLAAERLRDPPVLELAHRVRLSVDPELDSLFPQQTPARVVLSTRGRRLNRRVDTPKGDAGNPLSRAALEAKFRSLALWGGVSQERADRILTAAGELSFHRVTSLMELLRPSAP